MQFLFAILLCAFLSTNVFLLLFNFFAFLYHYYTFRKYLSSFLHALCQFSHLLCNIFLLKEIELFCKNFTYISFCSLAFSFCRCTSLLFVRHTFSYFQHNFIHMISQICLNAICAAYFSHLYFKLLLRLLFLLLLHRIGSKFSISHVANGIELHFLL